MESEESFRLTAFFTGRVQGVGFRYSTLQIAKGFEVNGFVKNLADGRVELQVEGQEDECRSFLAEVESELDSFIRKTESREVLSPKEFKGFLIA